MCEHLVKRLQPDTEIVSVTLINKKNLIDQCGERAALLLREKCQRVIIVWDLYPPWRPKGEKPCRHEDRKSILESLQQAGVSSPNVYLVCICAELEAWLIADNRAIAKAISRLTGRKKPIIKGEKNPESVKNPKARLMKIFDPYTQYQAHRYALEIVKELPNFNKVKRCESFKRFVLKATGTKL